ncbi:MAG: L-threonylcarbamoyladenylate synthase [Candidatus Woesearchaeota archaeon]
MKTLILTSKEINKAAELIKKGQLVAFPTETVYGLGGNALNKKAVKKIFIAKGRPSDNPLIVHIARKKDIFNYAVFDNKNQLHIVKKLIKIFWPGPLTLILKKKSFIPDETTGNLNTIAIRMPKNKIALNLIKLSNLPIAAPSANLSGKPSGTTFKHVYNDFNGKISAIIKSKQTKYGLESTVIDLTTWPVKILRPGSITYEQLKKIIPSIVVLKNKKTIKAKSPGMKYRHYSPNAKIILFENSKNQEKRIKEFFKKLKKENKKILIIKHKKEVLSKNLYKIFRECDEKKIDYLLIKATDEKGIGLALMNRLRKAASIIIK